LIHLFFFGAHDCGSVLVRDAARTRGLAAKIVANRAARDRKFGIAPAALLQENFNVFDLDRIELDMQTHSFQNWHVLSSLIPRLAGSYQ